jgi:hypothetical protein
VIWTTVALFSALSLAPSDAGSLALTNVRSTYGLLGPTRTDTAFVPGDHLSLNFDIDGITVDEKGKVLYSLAIEVTNVADKSIVFRQPAQNQDARTVFGGNRIQGFAHIDIGVEQPPGKYNMKVTVTDRANNKSEALDFPFTVGKPDLAIVRFKTSSDPEGSAPLAALGTGQTMWVNFGIVGFARDATSKQPNVSLEVNILDGDGKSTLVKPLSTTISKDVPDKTLAIPLQYPVSLTRAGKFTLEFTATDAMTKKTHKLTIPLNVVAVK